MAKYVQIDAQVEIPSGTNRSAQLSAFNFESVRAEVEASVFTNKADLVALGTYKNSLTMTVRPDADWAFMKYLVQRLNDGANVSSLYRPQTAAKATGNPEFTFPIVVSKCPPFGVGRGELLGGQVQIPINGAITFDDGVDTIVLG